MIEQKYCKVNAMPYRSNYQDVFIIQDRFIKEMRAMVTKVNNGYKLIEDK